MNLLLSAPFFIWLYHSLGALKELNKNIRKFRAEDNYAAEQAEILKATIVWGSAIIRKLRVELVVEGNTGLPPGPVVFVSNHQSNADIPIFFAAITTKQFGFMAKEELAKVPIYGEWIRNIRSVFLQRDDARASLRAIDEGVDLLKKGFSLTIFPEGTRGKGGPMGEFKKGSLRLATKAGVPVVPITLNGSYHIYEEKNRIQYGAKVRFYVHPAIETAGMSKAEAAGLSGVVEEIVRGKLLEWAGDK